MAIDNNADFTPSIPDSGVVPTKLPYNPTGSFKFWAQKVLPLVYDDSLSYYEVLCKVVTYLNNVIQNVDNLNGSVNSTNQSFETLKGYVNTTKDTLINTYNKLQGYVNTYFDNLDVQEEINEKLDAMASSGELTNLLAPFIPNLVTAWLNEHVTPTSPVVDNTLSISGAAADAKVTGDNIGELKKGLNDIRSPLGINLFNSEDIVENLWLGDESTGVAETNAAYDASEFIPVLGSAAYTLRTFEYSGNALYRAYLYDSNKTFIERKTGAVSGYTQRGWVFTTSTTAAYIRLNFEKQPNASQNPKTCVLEKGSVYITEYVPYFTAYDLIARDNSIIFKSNVGITDADDITDIGFYYLSGNNVANLPSTGASWYLISIKLNDNNILQIAYNAQGITPYIRAKVIGTWGNWMQIAQSSEVTTLQNISIIQKSNTGITDADDITDIGYYYLSGNSVANLPKNAYAWYLISIKLTDNNMLQFAFNARGNNQYLRAKVVGAWGSWLPIGTDAVNESLVTSSVALFPTVGCCGDSFTAGYLYNKPESEHYDPNYVPNGEYPAIGYPAVMGRLYGVDVTAYAKGGLTSTAYRTDASGLPAILNDTPKDLYVISLGLNDKSQNIPIGVEADIDTEPASPTFLGNMGAIIRAIKTHAPLSRIILCKSFWMNTSYYNYISEGIELLSSHLGIPYLETLNDPYFSSSAYTNGLKGLHPTAPLYAGMGKRIGELIGKCVIDNPSYFYNFYVPNN